MTKHPRPDHLLCAPGNRKLGAGIYSFSIPAKTTCPGKSAACTAACYAGTGFLAYPSVQAAYARRYEATLRADFARRMIAEIRRNFVAVLRVHVAGDFYDANYARKWQRIAHRCPDTRFFGYTRSWRDPAILGELIALGRLPNVYLWFSWDRDTGPPPRDEPRIRSAFMADHAGSENLVDPATADLVFRTQAHRARLGEVKAVHAVPVCPHERPPPGHANPVATCSTCRLCFTWPRSTPSADEDPPPP